MMHGPINIRTKIISMLEQNGLKIMGIKKSERSDIDEALLKWFKQGRSDTVLFILNFYSKLMYFLVQVCMRIYNNRTVIYISVL